MKAKSTPIPQISKILLYPLALFYGAVTELRNRLYDRRYFRSVKFDFPVISVGNLTVGGTGKTPHIAYLIDLLRYVHQVAVLSRGYGRKSHGFVVADSAVTADDVGDEPLLLKWKFPETLVVVNEERILAIPQILSLYPDTDVLLLDDAFQHRSLRPGFSILLTEYDNLFTRDALMPVGWLREAPHNYRRADIIVVTKCPPEIRGQELKHIRDEIHPFSYQKIYFSTVEYGTLYSFTENRILQTADPDTQVLLVCAIAKFDDLKKHLQQRYKQVYVRSFRDHHRFDSFDLEAIKQTYENLDGARKMIVTTEKDAMRLLPFRNWFLQNKIEIFVQPIRIAFVNDDGKGFNQDILRYVETTKIKMHQP